jgi:hypothetical protein
MLRILGAIDRGGRVRARTKLGSIMLTAVLLAISAAGAPSSQAAPHCLLAGVWAEQTQFASTTFSIDDNGKAQESGGGNATGTASLAGDVLTIDWKTSNGYAGVYRWTLKPDCTGSGTLTFTQVGPGDDRGGKTYPSTVQGPVPSEDPDPPPAPTPEPDPCAAKRVHAAADNEIRIVALAQGIQFHKAGTPEDDWRTACKDTVLQQGDEISCDPDGAVTLQFADNSTVVVKNTTQLKIASFFTEGGVVKTEILLKMGEVAAQVHKSEATKSDFRIKSPTGTASVRGTDFSVAYDPGAKAMLTTVREGIVEVDPEKPDLTTAMLTAGQQVEVTAKAMSPVAAIGKAGARGGLGRFAALAKVLKVVAKADEACKITLPRENAFAVKEAPGGWKVAVKILGKRKGTARWTVKAKRARAANSLAKAIAKRCG